jgi:glyoxylase-like metal-dependent hydrolase (beta-lactamase superfamily II)
MRAGGVMEQLSERVYVAPGGTNIGVVIADDGRAVLIDTGLNDTPARKVLRAVQEELRTEVRAIFTTHGHGDHFGGNAFVVKRTGAKVYAPDIDELTLRHPVMQAVMLYGGADPVDTIRTRFLVADDGPVDGILTPGRNHLEGVEMEVVSLAGHSINQLGLVIDGIFFCADVVFPEATLAKYPIPYLYGLTDHLDALDYASTVECSWVVPGHGPTAPAIDALVERNRYAIDAVIEAILDDLDAPQNADSICADLFRRLDVPVEDEQAYFLLRPTVNAYLTHLQRTGTLQVETRDRQVLWQRA